MESPGHGRPPRLTRSIAAAAIALGLSLSASAQTEVPFNWGYASAFGRGLYRLDDGSDAQIYRAQIKPPLHKPAEGEDGVTVRLVLPVTFGLQEPLALNRNHVQEYSFMPGVELELKPGERFALRADAEAGLGKQTAAEQPSTRVAAFGLRARFAFANAPGRPAFIGGLRWAGVDSDAGERSSLLRVTTGLEFDIGTAWQVRGRRMRLLPHVLEDRYYRPHGWLALGEAPDPGGPQVMTHEWQVGLAAGRDEPFKIWFFKFNSLGVAYRFSEFSQGVRLYLNGVF